MKASELTEVWAIEITEGDGSGRVVLAADDSGGSDFLAYASEADAKRGAAHQSNMYGIECKPVRIKP